MQFRKEDAFATRGERRRDAYNSSSDNVSFKIEVQLTYRVSALSHRSPHPCHWQVRLSMVELAFCTGCTGGEGWLMSCWAC
jgi:hypothetical protein